MYEFGVRYFNGKAAVACYLINAPTEKDALDWGTLQGALKHLSCSFSVDCFGPHQ